MGAFGLESKAGRSNLDQSRGNPNNVSAEMPVTTTKPTVSSSTDMAGIDSKKLPCLPRSSWKLPKAGRLKKLAGPRNKAYFRLPQVQPDGPGNVGHLDRLELTAPKKNQSKQGLWVDGRIGAAGGEDEAQKQMQNATSDNSANDATQFGSAQAPEEYHRKAPSASWDELWRSIGGFDPGTPDEDYITRISDQFDLTKPGSGPLRSSLPSARDLFNEHRIDKPHGPPLPGPSTSGISTKPTSPSQSPRRFQTVAIGFPSARQKPSSSPKEKPTQEVNTTTGPYIAPPQGEAIDQTKRRQAPSSIDHPKSALHAAASLSSIALEEIEAQVRNNRTFSPSNLSHLRPPLDVNSRPSQPSNSPTAPPKEPLPGLPEQWDKTDAASRTSCYPSWTQCPSSPVIQPTSYDLQIASSLSASSDSAICPASPRKGCAQNFTDASKRSPQKVNSKGNGQTVSPKEAGLRAVRWPKLGKSQENDATVTPCSQHSLSSIKELQGQTSDGLASESDMATPYEGGLKLPISVKEVLWSRSERTKGLKFRDLATERAARIQDSKAAACINSATSMRDISDVGQNETNAPFSLSHLTLPSMEKPPVASQNGRAAVPKPASRRKGAGRGLSQQPSCGSPERAGRENAGSVMGPSRIMVLAETDPDSQMFRASAPTGSLTKIDMRKVETRCAPKAMKLRRQKSKQGARSEPQVVRTLNGAISQVKPMSQVKPSREHTPPPSNPSSPSSSDEIDSVRQARSSLSINGVAGLAKKDGLGSAPPKRASTVGVNSAEKYYSSEQQFLSKLGRESSELRLAMGLLSRKLERLTTFVETTTERDRDAGPDLFDLETQPDEEAAARFARSFQPRGWAESGEAISGPLVNKVVDQDPAGYQNARFRRTWTRNPTASHPMSLMSRYCRVGSGADKDPVSRPCVTDDVIWNQLDVLNRASLVRRAFDLP